MKILSQDGALLFDVLRCRSLHFVPFKAKFINNLRLESMTVQERFDRYTRGILCVDNYL